MTVLPSPFIRTWHTVDHLSANGRGRTLLISSDDKANRPGSALLQQELEARQKKKKSKFLKRKSDLLVKISKIQCQLQSIQKH